MKYINVTFLCFFYMFLLTSACDDDSCNSSCKSYQRFFGGIELFGACKETSCTCSSLDGSYQLSISPGAFIW